MILVHPQSQEREDPVPAIYNPVAVAAVPRFVIHGKRGEAVGVGRRRLWGKVTEQLLAAIHMPVIIAVKHEEGVIRTGGCP